MTTSWKEGLKSALIKEYGNKKGPALFKQYGENFPDDYADNYPIERAVSDIHHIEKISDKNPLLIHLYFQPQGKENILHLRLFQQQRPIPLSDILPMLENLDLRTDSESAYELPCQNKSSIYISDFSIIYNRGSIDLDKVMGLFQEAFTHIYFNRSENDGFNKLVLGASLSIREIIILRAYAKYLRQTGFRFSQAYIENALINQAEISKYLVELFLCMHHPANKENTCELSEAKIIKALESVKSLDEDKIIRQLLALINATLRTNYFQDKSHQEIETLSLKLNSRSIPDLPLPTPLYEVFVYSTRFEAIHLRNTKVARGGIRWSDRPEDFRTEILGLMKAQVVKNAVIVPSGAKGGFVLKKGYSKDEAINCYKAFIHGLLDITDNIKDKKVVRPRNVVCYDDTDPYLVVAADKGTASFSDIANSISLERGFWLGDAFASGGKNGYDHKKMGITARGAFESIKRHFRELEINVLKTDITVVGIGDLSGDVFGNGMIYTEHTKLIAAFDHRNIFVDPDPEPKSSYKERVRLFNLPTSSWEDYNPKLISRGGGVWKRSLKSIPISAQMQKALGIKETALPPNELVRAILKAPVDLLFNGGIGTYVKSSDESNADVGDRSNDYCRINGQDLRCKVVGEGGNLGFTQLGRIEYALKGGLINTDFIDNSAGVDCSDHEVNLKILLDNEVRNGSLSEKKRDEILASLTDEVAALVLNDNYNQALVLSFSAQAAIKNMNLHINYLKELEALGVINRKVEFMPDEKELSERKSAGLSLTRPEIAVMLAYTKIWIKHEILKTSLPEDDFLCQILTTAFPAKLNKKYAKEMFEHKLKRDIIATQLSNQVVNDMGITFVYRLQMETGSTIEEILKAYAIASRIYGTIELQKLIEGLDFKIPMSDQYAMMFNLRHLVNLSTRWFLHGNRLKGDLEKIISHYASNVRKIQDLIPTLMSGFTKEYLQSITERFSHAGLPIDIATRIATSRAIYTSLNIIEVATTHKLDLIKTAEIYFAGGERINLLWFRDQIASDTREGHWNTLARLTLRDELDIAQRALTIAILKNQNKNANTENLINSWMENNKRTLERWSKLQEMLHGSSEVQYTMFFITLRELLELIQTSNA